MSWERNVDVVLCIDVTESMKPLIENVKESTLALPDDLKRAFGRYNISSGRIRIRMIVFGNYLTDGKNAILATDFMSLPEEYDIFAERIRSISARDDVAVSSDGLEALAYAIRSDWNVFSEERTLQCIIVWSATSANDLGHGNASPWYDRNLPKDFSELSDWWGYEEDNPGYMDFRSKILQLFAPGGDNWWTKIAHNWDNVIHVESQAGNGLAEQDYEDIIHIIACPEFF